MKNLIQKIKPLYLKIIKTEEKYKRGRIEPLKDWGILLVADFLIFCILIIFSFYFYIQIKNDKFFYTNKSSSQEELKLDVSLLEKTISEIETRKNMADELRNKGSIYSDPAI